MCALFRRVFFCVHFRRGFLSAFYLRRFFRALLRCVFPVRSSQDFFRAFFCRDSSRLFSCRLFFRALFRGHLSRELCHRRSFRASLEWACPVRSFLWAHCVLFSAGVFSLRSFRGVSSLSPFVGALCLPSFVWAPCVRFFAKVFSVRSFPGAFSLAFFRRGFFPCALCYV